MPKLEVFLLGPLEIHWNGSPWNIPRRNLRMLLAYLSYQTHPVTRDDLMNLIWKEGSDSVLRRRLRELISRLRESLPQPDMLLTNGNQVSVNRSLVSVDALAFETLFDEVAPACRNLPVDKPLPGGVYQKAQKAVKMWRMLSFLPGASLKESPEFETWLTETSLEIENKLSELMSRLADHYAAIGDLKHALHYIQHVLEKDEFQMEAHYRLIRWLKQDGRKGEALQAYQRLFQKVRSSNGKIPTEIQALYEGMQRVEEDGSPAVTSSWSYQFAYRTVFIGRQEAIKTLQQVYRRGGSVALMGDPGSGKTRLMYEFFHSLQPLPRLMLTSMRATSTVPYQAISDVLRRSFTTQEWKTCGERYLLHLSRLMPELPALLSLVSADAWIAEGKKESALYESIRQSMLCMLQPGERVLFFLDDAQWCDEASFEGLAYLVNKRFFPEKGLLVVAYRPEISNEYLNEFLEFLQLALPENHAAVTLEAMTVEEVRSLALQFLDQPPDSVFFARLTAQSAGNPLFVLEMLNALMNAQDGSGKAFTLEQIPLPGNLQYLLHQRLRSISLRARSLLTAAAVIGVEFSPELLAEATHTPMEQVVAELERLERLRMVRPGRNQDGQLTYLFMHDRMREVLLFELSAARRMMLHQQVGNAMEKLRAKIPSRPETLAYHFDQGGDAQRAFLYWKEAGERATRLYDPRSANEAFKRAEKWISHLSATLTDEELYAMFTAWKTCAWESGDYDRFDYLCRSLTHLGNQRRSALLIVSALNGTARLLLSSEKLAEACKVMDVIEQFLADLQDRPLEVVRYHCKRALVAALQNQFQECLDAWERAQQAAYPWKDADVMHDITTTEYELSIHFDSIGLVEMTQELASHARYQYPAQVMPTAQLAVRRMATTQRLFHNVHYDLAASEARQGLMAAEGLQIWHQCILFRIQLARIAIMVAQFDESWEHIETALELIKVYGYCEYLTRALYIKGDIYRNLQNLERARELYQQALEAQGGGERYLLEARLRIGILDNYQQHFAVSLPLLREVLEKSRVFEFSYLQLLASVALGEGESMRGNFDAARAHFEEVMEEGNRRATYFPVYFARYLLGSMAYQQGQLDEAEEQARYVIEVGQANRLLLEIQGRLLLEKVLRQRGMGLGEKTWLPIQKVLERVEKNCQRPELHACFQVFYQNNRKAFEEAARLSSS